MEQPAITAYDIRNELLCKLDAYDLAEQYAKKILSEAQKHPGVNKKYFGVAWCITSLSRSKFERMTEPEFFDTKPDGVSIANCDIPVCSTKFFTHFVEHLTELKFVIVYQKHRLIPIIDLS